MRSCKVRIEQIAEPQNLREAFLRASRGKAGSPEVVSFRANLDQELASLRRGLLGGALELGDFTSFTIFEPKERQIYAPSFRERVLHHALIQQCESNFERWLIDDTFACRKGKGREKALHRAEHFSGRHPYFLKLDVRKYFDSIPHEIVIQKLARCFRDPHVVKLWIQIIETYQTRPGRGLPIGSLTSQHLANFYLSPIDRLVREKLRIPGYVRYMDDMVLWGSRDRLREAWRSVKDNLSALGLELKETAHLQPCPKGLNFLGYRVSPGQSRLARSSRQRFLKRWGWIEQSRAAGEISEGDAQRRMTAMSAFVRSARGERLLSQLFGNNLENDHRARTASTAAAVGTTPRRTAALPTATGTILATATITSASASPSAHTQGFFWPED